MSRPVNAARPAELREAIVHYLLKYGLAGLSLRPLAKALRCTPRVLLYHFGSKENMVIEILAHVRHQQRTSFGRVQAGTWAEALHIIWQRMSAPDSEPLFRLFFEIYGIALRQPRLYKVFLHDTIEDWLELVCKDFGPQRRRREVRAFATIVLAGLRGFMLDFCTTRDRQRLDHAVRVWLHSLESMLPAAYEAK